MGRFEVEQDPTNRPRWRWVERADDSRDILNRGQWWEAESNSLRHRRAAQTRALRDQLDTIAARKRDRLPFEEGLENGGFPENGGS